MYCLIFGINSLLVTSVSKENWFALLDNLVAATTLQQSQKKGRAFVALVTNEKHKMEQLTFDINDYKQQRLTKVRVCHCSLYQVLFSAMCSNYL